MILSKLIQQRTNDFNTHRKEQFSMSVEHCFVIFNMILSFRETFLSFRGTRNLRPFAISRNEKSKNPLDVRFLLPWHDKSMGNFVAKTLLWLVLGCVSFVQTYAQNSVLSEGRWFKIGITQTGVYRIDVAFLKKMGLNPVEINPQQLRLFGNGGAMLPQSNATPRAVDLIENAILVKGEADGRFDDGDALWFFGQGPHQVRYNTTEKRLEHELNLYSDTTFYFLQVGKQAGLRIASQKAGNSGIVLNSFDDYIFRESESYNRIQSGRGWWGEYFGTQTRQDFNAELSGILPDSPFKLTVASVAAAQVTTKFLVSINGQSLGEQTMGTVTTYRYDSKGQSTQKTYEGKLINATSKVTMTFNFDKAGQVNADGYLDFLGLQVQRSLRFFEQPTVFQNLNSLTQDSVRFSIAQANAQMQLWDVTDPLRPLVQMYRLNGTEASFGVEAKKLKRFVVFAESQLQIPVSVQSVKNQNIRAISPPDLLVITASPWQKQAQKLADFRRQNDGLEVAVVTTTQVYNEFASGQADPTAFRDFAKYLYDRQPQKLKYLLLLGDASYDYKNNMKALSPLEMSYFVPTYESRESGHPVLSFSSDDYYGFLKKEDGEWNEDYSGNHTLDIGVGRLPVKSIAEAEAVVNKLMRYNTQRSRGKWRQKIAFIADDGDGNLHQQDADNLSKLIAKTTATYDLRKVYVDAFPQIGTPVRAPEVSQVIDRFVNEGVLMMNYTGHGGTSIWADEQVVTLQNLLNWRNLDNMPLIITATCEFGRYDNPAEVSGAEVAVLSPRGGAIAMLSTARPVYASTNFLLNDAFYQAAFQRVNNQMPRLGDLMRITKNNSFSGVFNRNFTLLGDPSLRLNYPDYEVVVSIKDTLKANRLVKLSGEIRQAEKIVTDFNGTAIVTVYDKENQLITRGSEGSKMNYGQFQSKLFEGQVSVKQGKFSAEFVVPKNIEPKLGKGLIQVYAVRTDSLADAAGGNNQVLVGGSETFTNDIKPPTLQLYLNDETFVEGDEVEDSPLLVAKMSDENGFNFLQNMIVTLNDTFSVVVNDYFLADKDDFRKGTLRFLFQKLPAGDYHLKLKVADTYNNSVEGTLRFKVGSQSALIKSVIAYPNPFVEQTTLQLELVNEGEDVEVETKIFDWNGRLIRSESQTIYNSDKTFEVFTWDAANQSRQDVPAGIYVYRLGVHSITRQRTQVVGGKLIKPK
jgi:hypothetical protein